MTRVLWEHDQAGSIPVVPKGNYERYFDKSSEVGCAFMSLGDLGEGQPRQYPADSKMLRGFGGRVSVVRKARRCSRQQSSGGKGLPVLQMELG